MAAEDRHDDPEVYQLASLFEHYTGLLVVLLVITPTRVVVTMLGTVTHVFNSSRYLVRTALIAGYYRLPDGTSEIDAWIYGRNWCSEANKVSSNPDICDWPPADAPVEFLHMPMFNKFSQGVEGCYANVDIVFEGCKDREDELGIDYNDVTAKFTSKDKKSEYTYQCVQDSDHHGCLYSDGLDPETSTKIAAFASCGIVAEE